MHYAARGMHDGKGVLRGRPGVPEGHRPEARGDRVYHGEKAFEYLLGTHRFNMVYRLVFSFVVYFGCTQTLNLVWSFSDIANALMAIPNLICMLLLSGEIAKDIREFQKKIHKYN